MGDVFIDKKKKNHLMLILFLLVFCFIILMLNIFFRSNTPTIKKVYLQDNNEQDATTDLVVELDKTGIQCGIGNEDSNIKDISWKKSLNKKCIFKLESGNYYVFIKNKFKQVAQINYDIANVNKIYDISVNKEIYVPKNTTRDLDYQVNYIGNIDNKIAFISSDDTVVSVEDRKLIAKENGDAVITIQSDNGIKKETLVHVRDLFIDPVINNNKSYLTCNYYNETEAVELDTILSFFVNDAGKHTRAGVVAAGRFLTLQFPKKIRYFGESGRLSRGRKVDGEGRYYHEGLYLSKNKFTDLVAIKYGPAIWGCKVGIREINGLDCSGYVTWVILNGGFDVGDIGAGITNVYDLTDVGIRTPITNDLIYKKGEVKAGDLIGFSGHIAIILGIDDKNYYIGESTRRGVTLSTYSKEKIVGKTVYKYVVKMGEYYKEEGNYTEMW